MRLHMRAYVHHVSCGTRMRACVCVYTLFILLNYSYESDEFKFKSAEMSLI